MIDVIIGAFIGSSNAGDDKRKNGMISWIVTLLLVALAVGFFLL